jgi:hypothetical protein
MSAFVMNDEAEIAAFSDFRRLIREHLQYLFDDFGFDETEATLLLPGMWVSLQNRTTRIMFHFEYGSGAWTTIGKLALIDGCLVAPDEYALDDLLAVRAPNLGAHRVIQLYNSQEVEKFVKDVAVAYRWHAADILRGEFSVFSELDRLHRERVARPSTSETE